jgi:hypothetical protein
MTLKHWRPSDDFDLPGLRPGDRMAAAGGT